MRQTCFRYEVRCNAKDEQIAEWLLRLTNTNRYWGFECASYICVT